MLEKKCKKCRMAGEKLFLKGERCYSPKCAMVRHSYRPGIHGKRRRVVSEYGRQLLEKQKIKLSYGVRERQFKKYFREASKRKGVTAAALLEKLERRLDNVVYRLGFAPSRSAARQLVLHGHFLVNAKRVTIPSFEVKPGQRISIRPNSFKIAPFKDLKSSLKKFKPPAWLSLETEKLEGKVLQIPNPEQIQSPFDISLIIEHYSR